MKDIRIILLLFLSIMFVRCQDIEDTYKEFSQDGHTRNIGKCYDLSIDKGFNRVKLNWKNNVDPTIDSIRIKWIWDYDKCDSVTLPKGTTEYTTKPILANFDYEFDVFAVNKDGEKSLNESLYCRPYSLEHEKVCGSVNPCKRYFKLENKVIFILDRYFKRDYPAFVNYYENEELKQYIFTEEDFKREYVILENVNVEKEVCFQRSIAIEDCFDEIKFDPSVLEENKFVISPITRNELKWEYGLDDVSQDFMENVEELSFNWEFPPFEDLLYCKNLKKIKLCDKRYCDDFGFDPVPVQDSSLLEASIRLLHDIYGVEVEAYNNVRQLADHIDFVQNMPRPILPEKEYYSSEGWKIIGGGWANYNLVYETGEWNEWYEYTNEKPIEVIFDFKQLKNISGILMVNNPAGSWKDEDTPTKIVLQYKTTDDKNEDWQDLYRAEGPHIGRNFGESKLIEFKNQVQCKYVRFLFSTNRNYVSLRYVRLF